MARDLRDHIWRNNLGVCEIVAAGLGIAASTATAVGTAAVIGGVGSIAGGAIASSGAKSAAKTQAAAATNAADKQAALGQDALNYQKGIDQRTYGDLAGYRGIGTAAMPAYEDLLGIGPNGAAGRQAALEATPGYQFNLTQGLNAEARSLGSKGLTGAQSKGIARFVTGLADNTYGSQLDRYNTAIQTGLGAVGTGGGIGVNTGNSVGTSATNIGNAIASGINGAANASAGGIVGSANAISGGLSGAANGLSNAYLYSKLLGQGGGGGLYSANNLGAGVTNI